MTVENRPTAAAALYFARDAWTTAYLAARDANRSPCRDAAPHLAAAAAARHELAVLIAEQRHYDAKTRANWAENRNPMRTFGVPANGFALDALSASLDAFDVVIAARRSRRRFRRAHPNLDTAAA